MSVATAMTAEQFLELPGDPGKRFELHDGKMVEVPFAGMLHGAIVGIVYRLLTAVAIEHGGYVFADGVGYVLSRDPETVRGPDVSYITADRFLQIGLPVGFWPGPPDLAVEVVSPSDRANEIHAKTRDSLDAGTQLVWVLWPETRSVTVTHATGASRELGPDASLDGGTLLPGLRVLGADLFPPVG